MKVAGTLLVCIGLVVLLAGCQKTTDGGGNRAQDVRNDPPQDSTSNSAKAAADWTANEILKRLLATYRQAKTYRDNAVVRLAFRQNGQPVAQEQPFAVAYERPDKLSIAAFQATVKSDGRELKARIE